MRARRRRQLVIGILLLLIVNAAVVLFGAGSLDGTEITRYRNAFLAKAAGEQAFQWTPENIPADFLKETMPVPEELRAWVRPLVSQESAVATSIAIARALSVKPRYGDPIQLSTTTTLNRIVTQGTGYCVDYTKAFTGLAYAAGLIARQWAFSFDGFGGHGHMFSEVWDAQARQWVMVDVFHGFLPRDVVTGAPLSALEFRRRLASAAQTIRWDRITPYHFAFKNDQEALEYYRRGRAEWYLWWGNNVFSYDNDALVAQAMHWGHLPEQISAMLTGVLPPFKVLLTDGNNVAFNKLQRLRNFLSVAAALEIILGVALVWNIAVLYKDKQNRFRRS